MKTKRTFKSFLPALAVVGLLSGGFVAKGQDSPTNNEKPTLADFLPGKRVIFPVPEGQELPPGLNMNLLIQFEKNGVLTVGMVMNGKANKAPRRKNEVTTYKVEKQRVIVLRNGKAKGGMSFKTATPKKGDEVTLDEPGDEDKDKVPLKIISIEKAAPLKDLPPGGPFGIGPAPEQKDAPKKRPELKRPEPKK